MTQFMRWKVETATGIGGRVEQQDRVTAVTSDDGRRHLVVVADGMGGLDGGAAAAQTVVEVAAREFRIHQTGSPRQLLERICRFAHRKIGDDARRRRITAGSTCVALYLDGDEAYWIHVGDSRLYHFRAGELSFSTEDHSWAGLMSHGHNGGDIAGMPAAQQLYACLGGETDLISELGATALGDEDWFLLCSDGFWSQVTAEEVAARVVDGRIPGVAKELSALAADRAGPGGDNVTLAIVRRQQPGRLWKQAIGWLAERIHLNGVITGPVDR